MTSGEALVIYLAGIMPCAWVLMSLRADGYYPSQRYEDSLIAFFIALAWPLVAAMTLPPLLLHILAKRLHGRK
jgi:peptidoglycan biosynthesis protein MviN/MurJ (putative lipid II flippase)